MFFLKYYKPSLYSRIFQIPHSFFEKFIFRILYSTLHRTPKSILCTSHFTVYTPRSIIDTPTFTSYTPQSTITKQQGEDI